MDWIEKLKPGDPVIVVRSGMAAGETVKRVKTVDKLHVTIDHGNYTERFKKHNGFATGEGWNKPYIEEATPERIAEVRSENERLLTAGGLEKTNWRNQPLKVLKAVSAILVATQEQVDRILEEIKSDGR